MKKITKRIHVFIVLALMINGASCEKIVEVSSPSDRIISAEVFSNDAIATAALLGLYQDMTGLNGSVGNFGLSLYPGFPQVKYPAALQSQPMMNSPTMHWLVTIVCWELIYGTKRTT